MITQSLPGITSLGYVPSERLQRQIMQKALAGLPVGVFTDIAPINFVGVPTCVTQSDYDNNGRLEKASLKFVTNDFFPPFAVIDTHDPIFGMGFQMTVNKIAANKAGTASKSY